MCPSMAPFLAKDYGQSGGNFYDALCVSKDASLEVIRRNFHSAALTLHPDKQSLSSPLDSQIDNFPLAASKSQPRGPSRTAAGISETAPEPSRCKFVPSCGTELRDTVHGQGSPADNSCERIRQSDAAREPDDPTGSTNQRFLRVQEAWAVLRDSTSRALYDRQLAALESRMHESISTADLASAVAVAEDVELEEMAQDAEAEEEGRYFYPCRCSDFYELSGSDVREAVRSGTGQPPPTGADTSNLDRNCRLEVIVPCGSCSLNIRVSFAVDMGQ